MSRIASDEQLTPTRVAAMSGIGKLAWAASRSGVGLEQSALDQLCAGLAVAVPAWALSHAIGIGEVLDVVGSIFFADSMVTVAEDLVAFYLGALRAQSEDDLRAAGALLGSAVLQAGIGGIFGVTARLGSESPHFTRARYERQRASGGPTNNGRTRETSDSAFGRLPIPEYWVTRPGLRRVKLEQSSAIPMFEAANAALAAENKHVEFVPIHDVLDSILGRAKTPDVINTRPPHIGAFSRPRAAVPQEGTSLNVLIVDNLTGRSEPAHIDYEHPGRPTPGFFDESRTEGAPQSRVGPAEGAQQTGTVVAFPTARRPAPHRTDAESGVEAGASSRTAATPGEPGSNVIPFPR